ncbi:MAG: methyl-accepting chemotaxis protein [Lentilitoribacter sp.]
MRLSHQLLLAMSLTTVVAIGATSYTGIKVASGSLEEAYNEKLSAIADGRRNQLETFFQGVNDNLSSLAKNDSMSAALNMFKMGIEQVKAENPADAIKGLYEFKGAKEDLFKYYKETGLTGYGTQLSKFGPLLKQFAADNSLGDLYLVNKNGVVVYSAAANAEISTNLDDGPFTQTALGSLYAQLKKDSADNAAALEAATESGTDQIQEQTGTAQEKTVRLADFEPYSLLNEKPVAFVGIPVTDAKHFFFGAIIAQLSEERIAQILNNDTGLGTTGETVLLRNDGTLLSDSSKTAAIDPLVTKIDLSPIGSIEGREIVSGILNGYRDMETMAAVAKVSYGSAPWQVAAIVDHNEALQGATTMRNWILSVAMVALLAALGFAFWFARSLTRPINAAIDNMHELSNGNTDFELRGDTRKDEVGDIVRSIEHFRQSEIDKLRMEEESIANRDRGEKEREANEAEKQRQTEEVSQTVAELAKGLEVLAGGDLVTTLDNPFMEGMEPVRQNFNGSVAKLRETLSGISNTAGLIRDDSNEISSATDDLSRRTESQAAALEEAAAALTELTENVRSASEQAAEAASLAQSAKTDTDQSSEVVSNAMSAMSRIETASSDISGIINVIDEIAFQTNLLALNAGVEAARAGEAGKGFAVVAQEVRELAQRSATAAKEIKELITRSGAQVQSGVDLVAETGEALKSIVKFVTEMNEHVHKIDDAAQEQASGLKEINRAVNSIDEGTQQNAAMAEEVTASGHTLSQEVQELNALLSEFQLNGTGSTATEHYKAA